MRTAPDLPDPPSNGGEEGVLLAFLVLTAVVALTIITFLIRG